jgi:hypothetical protein
MVVAAIVGASTSMASVMLIAVALIFVVGIPAGLIHHKYRARRAVSWEAKEDWGR